jgi:hypothetical protein
MNNYSVLFVAAGLIGMGLLRVLLSGIVTLIKKYITDNVRIVSSNDTPRKTIANGTVAGKYENIIVNIPVIIAAMGTIVRYRNSPGNVLLRVTMIAYIAKIAARKNEEVLMHAFVTSMKKVSGIDFN